MSIWGKIIGGVAGFALGGPLGAILGAAFGHTMDQRRKAHYFESPKDALLNRQTAFTVAVIVLSAKMAKADGRVTRDEVDTFKKIFDIPMDEIRDVGHLFNEARQDASGFEPYAKQIGEMFSHDKPVRESLLGGLFQIALSDGHMHRDELKFLENVAFYFNLSKQDFQNIRAVYTEIPNIDPYHTLGIEHSSSDSEIKNAYRRLSRENHPDTLIAKGMPKEFIEIANEKMANINTAYDQIMRERSR